MRIKSLIVLSALSLAILVVACNEDEFIKGASQTKLELNYNGPNGEVFSDVQQLGRVLFYDEALSANYSVSCGSCHKQSLAFADDQKFSPGMERLPAARNTPPIQNLGMFARPLANGNFGSQKLFWDGRVENLGSALTMPFFNHVEMGMDHTGELIERVQSRSYYANLFTKAFGDNTVNMERIATALSEFVFRLRADDTRFDQNSFTFNEHLSFNEAESRGLNLFFGKYNCGSCHALHSPIGYNPNQLDDGELVNIGLDQNYSDQGRADVTLNHADRGKFKIPNLRNVTLTAPYMHDGRFETLEQVIDHYSTGVQNHPNLDERLKGPNGSPMRLNITAQEKADLIAFLKTLTSNDLLTNPLLSDPFTKN